MVTLINESNGTSKMIPAACDETTQSTKGTENGGVFTSLVDVVANSFSPSQFSQSRKEGIAMPSSLSMGGETSRTSSSTTSTRNPETSKFSLIIGMSANSDVDTKNAALSIGMDYFIPKPFNTQQFLNLVNRLKLNET